MDTPFLLSFVLKEQRPDWERVGARGQKGSEGVMFRLVCTLRSVRGGTQEQTGPDGSILVPCTEGGRPGTSALCWVYFRETCGQAMGARWRRCVTAVASGTPRTWASGWEVAEELGVGCGGRGHCCGPGTGPGSVGSSPLGPERLQAQGDLQPRPPWLLGPVTGHCVRTGGESRGLFQGENPAEAAVLGVGEW